MSMPKTSKLYQYLNYRMRVTIQDGRLFVGTFMAFDKHLNVVLGDCEEFRKIIPKDKKGEEREEKRILGLIILRGDSILSLTVEGPPVKEDSRIKTLPKETILPTNTALPGIAKTAARGVTIPTSLPQHGPQPGLAGPVPTLGVPSTTTMLPPTTAPMMTPPVLGRGGLVPPVAPMGMPPMMGRGMPMAPFVPPMMGRGVPMMTTPMMGRGLPILNPQQQQQQQPPQNK